MPPPHSCSRRATSPDPRCWVPRAPSEARDCGRAGTSRGGWRLHYYARALGSAGQGTQAKHRNVRTHASVHPLSGDARHRGAIRALVHNSQPPDGSSSRRRARRCGWRMVGRSPRFPRDRISRALDHSSRACRLRARLAAGGPECPRLVPRDVQGRRDHLPYGERGPRILGRARTQCGRRQRLRPRSPFEHARAAGRDMATSGISGCRGVTGDRARIGGPPRLTRRVPLGTSPG
jgi:hypothetical protein